MPTPRWTGGWEVTTSNRDLPFDRGGDLDAVLRLGSYLPAEFATEVARAMNAADAGQAYTCVYSFTTRKFIVDNGATAFNLEFSRNPTTNCAGLLGFDDVDRTSTADGHESTDTVGTLGSFFAAAGVFSWAPVDPVTMTTPVTAAADGTTATLLQRGAVVEQNVSDGGVRESVYLRTDKFIKLRMEGITTGAEQTAFELLLDWIERGRRVNYQPDASSVNALRLVLVNPGDLGTVYTWLTRADISSPELVFVQQL